VVVAVIAVRVVQVTADQVVDVISVRDRLVTAAWSMFVIVLVLVAVVPRRAVGGVGVGHRDRVGLDAVGRVVVQLPVVQVVDVVVMADGRVPAGGAVLVLVLVAHRSPFS
jgi:hypothetical protein